MADSSNKEVLRGVESSGQGDGPGNLHSYCQKPGENEKISKYQNTQVELYQMKLSPLREVFVLDSVAFSSEKGLSETCMCVVRDGGLPPACLWVLQLKVSLTCALSRKATQSCLWTHSVTLGFVFLPPDCAACILDLPLWPHGIGCQNPPFYVLWQVSNNLKWGLTHTCCLFSPETILTIQKNLYTLEGWSTVENDPWKVQEKKIITVIVALI